MRMKLILALGLVVLAVFNLEIYRNQRFIGTGEEVFFELAPMDPRSLLQGDYMSLNYKITDELGKEFEKLTRAGGARIPPNGKVVVALNEGRVASFQRTWSGEQLAENERLVRYRMKSIWQISVGSESFLVQEGQGAAYAKAHYGIFMLGNDGRTILRDLADENLVRITPDPKVKNP